MSKITSLKKCSACGNSPVNHRFLFFTNVFEETLGKLGDSLFNFTHKKGWQDAASLLEEFLLNLFSFLGIARYSKDIEKAVTGRSKLIWEEAVRRNIPMEQVVILGKYLEFYRAKVKINGASKNFYFQSLPIPPYLHQSGYKWLDDKFTLFEVLSLSKSGIQVPKGKKVSTWSTAKEAWDQMQKPVIIKPKYGSRGRHTTTNINTIEELRHAFDLAREITLWMVVQEHLSGSVCRATVINNELVGFFRGDLPKVAGENGKTIKELIEEKNNARSERVSEIIINEDLIDFIKRQGYGLDSVVPDGKEINLSAKTGRMYGSHTREMLPEVHPKMYDIFKKVGELVKAPVVGFDLIIEDPTQDPDTQRWGIIECNSLPFIDLHYFALEGPRINLAKNVWDLWDK